MVALREGKLNYRKGHFFIRLESRSGWSDYILRNLHIDVV